jgi:hypothetical protein
MHTSLTKTLTVVGSIAFLAVLVLYTVYQGHDVFFGSKLSLAPIVKNTEGDLITLSGFAPHAKHITIDGRETAVDASGTFTEKVALLPGYNVISVTSKNPFGNVKTETIYAYRPTVQTTAFNAPVRGSSTAQTIN